MNIEHVLLLLEIKLPMNWTLLWTHLCCFPWLFTNWKSILLIIDFFSLDENEGILDPLLHKWYKI